ncbi:PadR family transcriptional regulator [Paenibacillus spongiae]|uniref:PadR family transcriptional regulator n=1 Tax=Paenibacillus spongiae TaxID=2909671 RepID=A0ABY5S4W6_9BACL|nr:PadR family transcriptional regulator [Paenibacillus spongiae]UVI27912.1 PadR family transcriptional regulator [Paenibacillus spongiae]
MDMSEWTSQARRGILEYSILLLISKKSRYGYELVTLLDQWEPLAVTEGTLYPLLRRLLKEKYIDSQWKESEAGPPRKYYSLTEAGHRLMEAMSLEWSKLSTAMNQIVMYRGEKS